MLEENDPNKPLFVKRKPKRSIHASFDIDGGSLFRFFCGSQASQSSTTRILAQIDVLFQSVRRALLQLDVI